MRLISEMVRDLGTVLIRDRLVSWALGQHSGHPGRQASAHHFEMNKDWFGHVSRVVWTFVRGNRRPDCDGRAHWKSRGFTLQV